MRILITGGTGYVGGRLALYLREKNKDAEIFLTTTKSVLPKWTNQFKIFKLNLCKQEQIRECIKQIKPDIIIHTAGMPQGKCEEDPAMAKLVNVDGTRVLLEEAQKSKVSKFIFISTFQVYGVADDLSGVVSELTDVKPGNVYAASKKKAEDEILGVNNDEMKCVVLRLSNAFGAPVDTDVAESVWGLAYNAFIIAGLKNLCIEPKADVYRDFIPLQSVVEVINGFVKSSEGFEGVYNLGSGVSKSIVTVAQEISQEMKSMMDLKVEVIEPEKSLHKGFVLNIDRLKKTGFFDVSNKLFNMELHQNIIKAQEYLKGIGV